MKDTAQKEQALPEGLEFLKLIWYQEGRCEDETDRQIPDMGIKAPQCLTNLGTVLSLLDRAASCFWGCPGSDHTIEYLTGRVYSSARASLRLIRFGFYDESLSITRSIGEIANLLFLFFNDRSAFNQWKGSTKRERMNNFSPARVRLALDALGVPLPMEANRYSELCEIATHVTPETKPQAHNLAGRPVLGGYFQEGGVLVSLNELAAAVSIATFASSKLMSLEDEIRKRIGSESLKLLRSVGAVDVIQMPQWWEKLRNNSDASSSP